MRNARFATYLVFSLLAVVLWVYALLAQPYNSFAFAMGWIAFAVSSVLRPEIKQQTQAHAKKWWVFLVFVGVAVAIGIGVLLARVEGGRYWLALLMGCISLVVLARAVRKWKRA